ncbi:MAG: hypothetical protein HY868_09450 [Chloroflexi bacterium]|nr:hypothetical protein [Chloroflexota bacterium]
MQRTMRGEITLPYSEVMRVIGAFIDRSNLTEVKIIETDEGLILQGLVMLGERAGERDTYQLSTQEVWDLLRDARAQRITRM